MSAAATVSQGQPYRYAGAEAGDDTLDFVHNRRQTPFGRSGFECNVHSYLQMPCTVACRHTTLTTDTIRVLGVLQLKLSIHNLTLVIARSQPEW